MFISNILKLTDWRKRIAEDRTEFLRDIIKAFLINLPYQNVTTFGAIKPMQRKGPDIKDVLESGFGGYGGLCGHVNYFFKIVLESIGYKIHTVPSTFWRAGIPSNHLSCLVEIPYTDPRSNFLKNKFYFVDVGCGAPIHEPILINQLPQHGRAGGLDYQYDWNYEGQLERVNLNGDCLVGLKPLNFRSPQNYTIDVTERKSFEDFKETFDEIYQSYDTLFLHHDFFLFRYLDISDSDDDFKAIWIRGSELVLVTRETRTVIVFDDIRQAEPYIHKYFPMINPSQVELSMENFGQYQKERRRQKGQKFERN